jgi:hypothetical protein
MDMKRLYLIIAVDQDGDPYWDVAHTLPEAQQRQRDMGELTHELPTIFRVDTETLETTAVP